MREESNDNQINMSKNASDTFGAIQEGYTTNCANSDGDACKKRHSEQTNNKRVVEKESERQIKWMSASEIVTRTI